MNKPEFKKYSLALVFVIFLVPLVSGVPVDWWGNVTIDSNTSTNGAPITAYINASTTASATDIVGTPDSGYYLIHVPCSSGENVTFKVCGVSVSEATQTCSGRSNELNLSISTLANGQACSYACGCTGGYCVHSICRSSRTHCGDGYCDSGETSSNCAADCGSGSSGTSGGTSTTSETQRFSISGGNSATIDFTEESIHGIVGITISVTQAVSNAQIKIEKESVKPSSVTTPSGEVYRYLTFTTLNLDEDAISEIKILFKISKTWVEENEIDVDTIRLNRYTDDAWEELTTSLTEEDNTYYYFEALVSGFSVFAITGEVLAEGPVCGNGICEEGENYNACPSDCEAPEEKICTPGTVRCQENVVQKCNSEGTEWDTLEVCNYKCLDGKCIGRNYTWVIVLSVIAFILLCVLVYLQILKNKKISGNQKSK